MGLNPSNHNTLTHTGRRVFIRKEAQNYLNPRVPHVPLFVVSVSTHTLKIQSQIHDRPDFSFDLLQSALAQPISPPFLFPCRRSTAHCACLPITIK
jgi:hypothetical protein